MAFFNKKEEVMDIQLTQFGRDLLARGSFKPVYYQMFDDDILYESELAGFTEHQNDTEPRIMKETPKFKSPHLTVGVETRYIVEDQRIVDGTRDRFVSINRNADPSIQERILLYPLHSQEPHVQKACRFNIKSHQMDFTGDVKFLELTGSGIRKKIPQLTLNALYTFHEDRTDKKEPALIGDETFIDLYSRDVVFADNTKISINSRDIVLDVEEHNTFYGLDNFKIEIFEVIETKGKDDTLRRIDDIDEINHYFHIKTDEDIDKVSIHSAAQRNYYKRGEEQ
jgi:hypothetical protein